MPVWLGHHSPEVGRVSVSQEASAPSSHPTKYIYLHTHLQLSTIYIHNIISYNTYILHVNVDVNIPIGSGLCIYMLS